MAQKKISQLPLATGPTGPDVMPIVNGGSTKRIPLSTLSTFFSAAGPTGPTGIVGPTGAAGAGEAYQGTTGPTGAGPGATWLNTADGRYHVRYDGLWVEVGGQYVA